MAKKKRKKTKIKEGVFLKKVARVASVKREERFSWTYRSFDKEGLFKNSKNLGGNLIDVFEMKKHLEEKSYRELGFQGSHFVDANKLSKEAQKRLKTLKMDDFGSLFSFRISGKQRLWCVKLEEGLMGVLWWDPEHKICPSQKRHT